MNRVYLRGCEVRYLEPLFGTSDFCEKPPAGGGRLLREGIAEAHNFDDPAERNDPPSASVTGPRSRQPARRLNKHLEKGTTKNSRRRLGGESTVAGPSLSMPTSEPPGSAGSLVIHIRSGDIFDPLLERKAKMAFPGYGQV